MAQEVGPYPGTSTHQHLLRAIAAFYTNDPRILAVGLFGSLSRGTWDALSDLDLDVVLEEGVQLDVVAEVERLVAGITGTDEPTALIIADGAEAADVVLPLLAQFSIRYHPLSTTSPNIVDSLQLLTGPLDLATVQAAGRANASPGNPPPGPLLDQAVRYLVETDSALRRNRLWLAVELMHRVRDLLMALYSRTHHGRRPLRDFEDQAGAELQAQLGQTLPQYNIDSLREALAKLIHLLQHDLPAWSQNQVQLSPIQTKILQKVVSR